MTSLSDHMDQVMELVMVLAQKDLGPCDGRLYMSACDAVTSYMEHLQRNIDAALSTEGKMPKTDPDDEGDAQAVRQA